MARDDKTAGEEQIKVVDRRLFDAEGNLRSDEDEVSKPEARESPGSQRAPAEVTPPSPGGESARSASTEPPPSWSDARAEARTGDVPEEASSFVGLVMSLSVNALMALGHAPGPEGGALTPDLGAARHLIDMLAMLAEKTAGNLTADEAHVLEQNLYELRMLFVEKSRGGPPRA